MRFVPSFQLFFLFLFLFLLSLNSWCHSSQRFDYLVEYYKPASVVPAYLNVTDIAGLVRGAASGEGLGNAFLSHIRAADGIMHLVR